MDVHFPVIVGVHADDPHGGTDHVGLGRASDLLPRANEDDPKRKIVLQTVPHHLTITILEHVQLKLCVWKKDRVERKKRQFLEPLAHVSQVYLLAAGPDLRRGA
jgi:hypothetical protein